jgi:hypothetical protein
MIRRTLPFLTRFTRHPTDRAAIRSEFGFDKA